ncbi:MAG: DoxX family membrane protein [Bacteroidetes bacterium]|nr:DoxX family membrane protein [Bacteroidota bacterium]
MKDILRNKYLLLVSRIILALIFVFAGIEKISNPEQFAVSISNYRIFPVISLNIIAITLPWLEVITGVLLLFGVAVKENSAVIGTLMILFTVFVFTAMLRGLDIDCGCFATSDGQKVGLIKILENIGLILLSIHVYFFHHKLFSIEN